MTRGSLLEEIARVPLSSAKRMLSDKLVESLERMCERCEKERMRLLLNPMCGKSRPLLTLLLMTRAGKIPRHCLEARLREIDQLARGIRKPDEIRDAAVPLDIFVSKVARASSFDEFLTKTTHVREGDSVSFLLGSVPCIKLSGTDIVVVNPSELRAERHEDVISFVKLLASLRNAQLSTRVLGDYLVIRMRVVEAGSVTRRHVISALGGVAEHVGVVKEGENTTIIVDLRPGRITFSDLTRLAELAGR